MPSKHSPYGGGSRALRCRECGRHQDDAGRMSARALCRDCGAARVMIPADQLTAKAGPVYETWKRSMVELAHRLIST